LTEKTRPKPRPAQRASGTLLVICFPTMTMHVGNPIHWLRGIGLIEWGPDERPYVSLLEALTRDRAELQATVDEMEATSRRDPADLAEEHVELAEEELVRARGELGTFRVALADLAARGGSGDAAAEVPYDAADPVQNAQADALIQYVVRPGYGEVRTEEPAPGRYVYFLRADWPRLRQLAARAGHDLPL